MQMARAGAQLHVRARSDMGEQDTVTVQHFKLVKSKKSVSKFNPWVYLKPSNLKNDLSKNVDPNQQFRGDTVNTWSLQPQRYIPHVPQTDSPAAIYHSRAARLATRQHRKEQKADMHTPPREVSYFAKFEPQKPKKPRQTKTTISKRKWENLCLPPLQLGNLAVAPLLTQHMERVQALKAKSNNRTPAGSIFGR